MDFVQYRTGTDDEGRRLDKVLRILFPETPLSNLYNCIRKGLIRVNQKKIRQDYHILSGDIVYVAEFLDFPTRSKPVSTVKEAPEGTLECIFKNEHILILNKPYDMPVHETSTYSGKTLNQYVLENFPSQGNSLSFKPGPLHRLDRKTTGLITFSQSISGATQFTELIKKHEIKKHYLSVVEGIVSEEETYIDYLEKDDSDFAGFKTVTVKTGKETDAGKLKKAVTIVKPVAYGKACGKDITLIEILIETGRTHQIRSQCAAHGNPLFGDTAYGGCRSEGFFLHAYRLEIPIPNALGLPNVLTAPLPQRFRHFVEKYLPSFDLSTYNQLVV